VSALVAHGLACGWGQTRVVAGVDLALDSGEVTLLAGPNGAGKTTTLLTLAGAIRPLSGTVTLGGRATRASLDARARAGLAFVPEGRHVFARLTVKDNLRLGRGPVERAIELFPELEPLLGRIAGTLSGGEQQMLRLGRALAGEPLVLLVDELSLGLAPQIVKRLLARIRHAADAGAAVLIVEQHVSLAVGIADRACVLASGEVALRMTGQEMSSRLPEIEAAYLSPAPSDERPHPQPPITNGHRLPG
jgi:branched-chain amino acid transport system ATP-binding protein